MPPVTMKASGRRTSALRMSAGSPRSRAWPTASSRKRRRDGARQAGHGAQPPARNEPGLRSGGHAVVGGGETSPSTEAAPSASQWVKEDSAAPVTMSSGLGMLPMTEPTAPQTLEMPGTSQGPPFMADGAGTAGVALVDAGDVALGVGLQRR